MEKRITVALLCLALGACGSVDRRPTVASAQGKSACTPISAPRLEAASDQASRALASGTCVGGFDEYWASLLDVAARQPSDDNRAVLAAFLSRQRDAGVISRDDARLRFSSHFDARFVTLPDEYNTCAYRDSAEAMMRSLTEELRQKRRGLLEITDDRASYEKALRLHQDMKQILLAARTACTAA